MCFAKGGVGIIRQDLYIDLKSTKNELLLNQGKRWSGLPSGKPEVVIFFKGGVWSLQFLPEDFALSEAVIISFETNKVRFFDFAKMSGCYYNKF